MALLKNSDTLMFFLPERTLCRQNLFHIAKK